MKSNEEFRKWQHKRIAPHIAQSATNRTHIQLVMGFSEPLVNGNAVMCPSNGTEPTVISADAISTIVFVVVVVAAVAFHASVAKLFAICYRNCGSTSPTVLLSAVSRLANCIVICETLFFKYFFLTIFLLLALMINYKVSYLFLQLYLKMLNTRVLRI